jgi:hypothetical protein
MERDEKESETVAHDFAGARTIMRAVSSGTEAPLWLLEQ